MLTISSSTCQRWRDRQMYVSSRPYIDTRRHEVAYLDTDVEARGFVVTHHYSASYPAARRRYGLWCREQLVGVAVFSVPVHPGVLRCLPDPAASLELGRFVLLDEVAANGETWFLARTFELLAADGFSGAVAFSDDVPRTIAAGNVVFPGHIGTIYQASNASYRGRGRPATLWLDSVGRVIAPRSLSKLRNGERGAEAVERHLRHLGAPPRQNDEKPGAWIKRILPLIARRVRHPGCHKYAFGITRRARRHLPLSLDYPKLFKSENP